LFSETIRLYPPGFNIDRNCTKTYRIPGTNIDIPKGTTVRIPACGIHKDPEIYPNPEKYDPERFSPENKQQRSTYNHMPFGHGPRNCIGLLTITMH